MRVAIVEWWPRPCGAVSWALHLSHARPRGVDAIDRLTFSSSGRPLSAWDRPHLWQVHRLRDAVEVLNAYDLVILSDVVCCAPAPTKDPYYVPILERLKVPWTSMAHDGAYRSKHDDTIKRILATKSFTGALITTRLREARARFDPIAPRPIRWLEWPYLPYSFDYAPAPKAPPLRKRAARGVLMTSRIAVNKGQNVAMYLAPRAGFDLRMFGYNSFGLPSIGWRLWELSQALEYQPVRDWAPPNLRRDVSHLTHPRANRFYTGTFRVRSGGVEMSYHDGFDSLDDVDWSLGRVHLSLSNTSVRGTLEYVTLEAIAAGAVAVVPAHALEYADYPPIFTGVPYTRAVIWARKDGSLQFNAETTELDRTIAALRKLFLLSAAKLERLAHRQLHELKTKHDPDVVLDKLITHSTGGKAWRSSKTSGTRRSAARASTAARTPTAPTAATPRRSPRRAGTAKGRRSPDPEPESAVPKRPSTNPAPAIRKDARVMSARPLKAIGSNIFAGGFTVGVKKHFDVVAHLEHDDYGVEVSKANFPDLQIFIGADAWPQSLPKGSKLDFLYSNPPCAIWSLAGNREGRVDWRKDPRLQRIRDIHALLGKYRPDVWCWESVCQAFERGREFVESLADAAAELGYSATYLLIDAMYLRAAQTRKRFFLVLHRVAIDWEAARPDFEAKPVTIGDTLKGVKPNRFQSRIADTPIGKQLRRIIEMTPPGGRLAGTYETNRSKMLKGETSKKNYGKPSFLAYRIDPSKVAGVLFGDKTFHHKEIRHLALNELGAIHGFPKDYDWVGEHHRLDVQRGVLPPVAEWLARNVAAAIRAGKVIRKPTRTLVDFRRAPGAIRYDVGRLPAQVDLDWRPGETEDAAANRAGPSGRNREKPTKLVGNTPKPGGPSGRKPAEGVAKSSKARSGAPGRDDPMPRGAGKSQRAASRDRPDGRPSRSKWTDPATGEALTSGEYIRARLLERRYADEDIVALVLERFDGRRTTTHDVAWNRRKIELDGGPRLERLEHTLPAKPEKRRRS